MGGSNSIAVENGFKDKSFSLKFNDKTTCEMLYEAATKEFGKTKDGKGQRASTGDLISEKMHLYPVIVGAGTANAIPRTGPIPDEVKQKKKLSFSYF